VPARGSSTSAPNAGHWVPYAAGLLTIAVALLSPLDAIGDKYLLSAHMLQHVLLSDIAPALVDPWPALADPAAGPIA